VKRWLKTSVACRGMRQDGKTFQEKKYIGHWAIELVGVRIRWSPRYNRKNWFVGVLISKSYLYRGLSPRQLCFHSESGLLIFSSLRYSCFLSAPLRAAHYNSQFLRKGSTKEETSKAKRRTREWRRMENSYTYTNTSAPTQSAFLSNVCLHECRGISSKNMHFILKFNTFIGAIKIKSIEDSSKFSNSI